MSKKIILFICLYSCAPILFAQITTGTTKRSRTPFNRKETIVIDGEALGINYSTTQTIAIEPTRTSPWWAGFEKAYNNSDTMEALLRRAALSAKCKIDAADLMSYYKARKYKTFLNLLEKNIIEESEAGGGKKGEALSDLYACAGLLFMDNLYFSRAEDWFKKSLKADENNKMALLFQSENFAQEGRFDLALANIRPLLVSPYFPVRLSALLSRIEQHQNQISNAIYQWKRVLERIEPSPHETFRLKFLESELYIQRHFLTYSTARYEVRYDPIFEDTKETVISPLLAMVDEVRESLDKRLNAIPANKIMILVYSEETFNSLLGGAFRRIEGFFSFEDAKIRLAVKSRSLQDVRFLKSTICHEYVHFLIHYISQGRLRIRWLHEGIASYFEKAETGFDPFADIDQAATRVPVDLSALLQHEITDFGYYQSRLVIEYLVNRRGERQIVEFLKSMGEGDSFEDALYDCFGLTLDEFVRAAGEGNLK